jgi:hypothetical protein
MRASVLGAVVAAAILTGVPAGVGNASDTIRLAQLDSDTTRLGPQRTPRVVIEEPRPPRSAIETEGRGEGRRCRSAATAGRQDGGKPVDLDHLCDR